MAISSILSAAVSGLQANATRAQVSANNVVNADSEDFTPSRAETTTLVSSRGIDGGSGVQVQVTEEPGEVNLVREFTEIIQAETAYKASAQLVQTAEELDDALLDTVRRT